MKADNSAHACTPRDVAEPEEPVTEPPVIATRIFWIVVPLCLVLFAWAHAAMFIHTLQISILLILAKSALEIRFYVRGSTTRFVSTSAYAWLIALCGTVAPLLFRPNDAFDYSLATVIQAIGLSMQIYIVYTLTRRAGMVSGKHRIRRNGLHRIVRHPLCLAFMLSQYGYVLNHTTAYNVSVLVFVTVFQLLRIKEEERLMGDDEEYQEYAEQTHWRVIPHVF